MLTLGDILEARLFVATAHELEACFPLQTVRGVNPFTKKVEEARLRRASDRFAAQPGRDLADDVVQSLASSAPHDRLTEALEDMAGNTAVLTVPAAWLDHKAAECLPLAQHVAALSPDRSNERVWYLFVTYS